MKIATPVHQVLERSRLFEQQAIGRYYVSQALLQHQPGEAGSLARIAAPAIEELVVERAE